MRAYYGSRFSPNQTATPEGFLICHNVPIARTGWYDYLGEEIGVTEMTGKVVRVYRSPEEVFSPAAMASFEGKILTDEHPPDLVTPDNATRYGRGTVQYVRQGSGTDSDLLLADLVVYDQMLIKEVQDGKREVSAGYECVYEPLSSDGPNSDEQTFQQKQICGNHVAVVKNGRAGDRVAIKDSKNQKPEGERKMGKIALPKKKTSLVTDFLAAVGLKHFATDAEPEEIMDAVNAMAEEKGGENEKEEPKAEGTKDQDPAIQALSEQVSKLTEIVAKLVQGAEQPAKPEDAIDAVIAELEKPGTDAEEESHTIPAEQFDEEGPVSSPEDRPKSALTGDNASKISFLKSMKPAVAAIADPVERKRVADAMLASVKGIPTKNTYAAVKPQKPTADTKTPVVDHSQLGKEIARKFNPHYKERA